jgi:hypothetical protein
VGHILRSKAELLNISAVIDSPSDYSPSSVSLEPNRMPDLQRLFSGETRAPLLTAI